MCIFASFPYYLFMCIRGYIEKVCGHAKKNDLVG